MARLKRIDYPGAWHHVMNRGARREPIFRDPDHCSMFLDRLGMVSRRMKLDVHAYVLMPNHFHLLVQSVRGNLSRCMQELLGPYTQELNRKHGWDGPVFRGRFKNQVISAEEHLEILIPYIHLNPVRARLVTVPEFAHWSSYTAYVGVTPPPDWLKMETVLGMYHGVEQMVRETKAYQRKELSWPLDFDLDKSRFGEEPARIPDDADESPALLKQLEVAYIKKVFETVTGESWARVTDPGRGRSGNPAKRFAVWLLKNCTQLRHREIGELIGSSASQVSLLALRLRRSPLEPPLHTWIGKAWLWIDAKGNDMKPEKEI